jgi:hypothetical protein
MPSKRKRRRPRTQAMLEPTPFFERGIANRLDFSFLARRIYAEYRDLLDLAHITFPGGHRPRHSRSRFFSIDLINTLEADSRAARPHRQLVEPAI